uniref:Ribosomal protein S7 n=1 Tax=prasinophyte sp. MBIC10622 TaxID=156113 RepID=A0A650AKJ1_9CHLO|nr:ribosomal protein S7 [prasinophyte sp. MBIC10622]
MKTTFSSSTELSVFSRTNHEQEILLERFVRILMKHGDKSMARRTLQKALRIAKHLVLPASSICPSTTEFLEQVILHVRPSVEVRRVRVAGTVYQTPSIVPGYRQDTLAFRWLIEGGRQRHHGGGYNKGFSAGLGQELADAWNKQGYARKKRDDLHRLAEANRAYAHYRWW